MKSLRSSVKLHRLQTDVAKLPPIPPEVIHILDVGTAPEQDLAALIVAVRRSSVVSRAVIREANALSTCAAESRTSVVEAIADLGRTRVMVIALGSAVVGVLDRMLDVYGKDRHQMWQHSVVTAHVAELLVQVAGAGSVSGSDLDTASDLEFELPIASLLHDVGTVVLAGHLKERWVPRLRSGLGASNLNERAVFGIDHAEVGADIVEQWGLSVTVVEAIRFHHEPAICSTALAYGILLATEVSENLMHTGENTYSSDARRGADVLGVELECVENGARRRLAELGIQVGQEPHPVTG